MVSGHDTKGTRLITVDSPIVGKAHEPFVLHLDTKQVKRLPDVTAYMTELVRLCELVGFNWHILFAQAALETNDFASHFWEHELNPAGIGKFDDGSQQSIVYLNGTDAARAQIVHMAVYVLGGGSPVWLQIGQYTALDPRLQAVRDAGFDGTVKVIGDLGNGKWATDSRYAEKIAAKVNQIFKEEPSMATPVIYELMRDYARFGISQEDAATVRGYRFENRQGMKPTFIVLHIQAGTTRSSLDWWANGFVNGQKVTASSTVMIQKDGSILQVIPEQHGPWTNGDDNQPTPTGQRLVNLPGNSNLHTLSIEAEGMSGADTTAKQRDSIVWQVEQWMATYGIPKANVIRHGDINSVDRPNCPGAYYPIVMARIGGGTTPAPKPVPFPIDWAVPAPVTWNEGDVGLHEIEGKPALAFLLEVEVIKKQIVPQVSDTDTRQAGPVRKRTTKLRAIGSYRGVDRNAYVVLRDGSRIKRSDVRPLVPLPSRA